MKNIKKLVEHKLLREGNDIRIKQFTRPLTSEEVDDLQNKMFDLSTNGIMWYSDDDSTPMPWDGGIDEIALDHIKLVGGAGPSGWGHCEVIYPLENGVLPEGIKFLVEYPDDKEEVAAILDKYGIIYGEE